MNYILPLLILYIVGSIISFSLMIYEDKFRCKSRKDMYPLRVYIISSILIWWLLIPASLSDMHNFPAE